MSFLNTPSNGNLSLDNGIVPAGTGKVEAGTVMGKLTANKKHFVPSPHAEVAGVEGAEVACAVLAYGVNATTSDVEVSFVDRDAEVKLPMLAYHASVDDQAKMDAKIEQLDAVGIRAR
ncbi:hypothetical protein OO25_17020 [Phaeobacter sp. S60]|nr:hypothetical protein OO25_17020 [Phaeobacter sp. S60]